MELRCLKYKNHKKLERLALMFIETRIDEIIVIATSCLKKPARVEIFQKSVTDMPIS